MPLSDHQQQNNNKIEVTHLRSLIVIHMWGLCFCVCIVSCLSSFPSVSPCVCVFVAGGVAAPELQQIRHTCAQFMPITLSIKAWSSHHIDAGLLLLHAIVMCYPTRLFILVTSRIYQPASTLPFQLVSTSPAHSAVPAGTYLSCSPCRSSRYLPLLLTLPFQPESTSPALINSVKVPVKSCSCLLWGPNLN